MTYVVPNRAEAKTKIKSSEYNANMQYIEDSLNDLSGSGSGGGGEGILVNGKISVTVAASDITLALKTLAGADPSVGDPVSIQIGGVIRSITAALSVTKNDATNWFNSGGAKYATKERDYFAFLGYNATDGVVIGFSPLPYPSTYGEFSVTTTAEEYCAISTITNAAATDQYRNIGRFAATLSAGAGYTWTVPTFTDINLVQKTIFQTRLLKWVPVQTGFSAPSTSEQTYMLNYNQMFCYVSFQGTSNSATFNFTLPFAPKLMFGGSQNQPIKIVDNSAHPTTPGLLGINVGASVSETAKVGINMSTAAANAYGGFTTSGAKGIEGEFFCGI